MIGPRLWPADKLERLRALREEPYTQKEADLAGGLRTDDGPAKVAAERTEHIDSNPGQLAAEPMEADT